MALVLALPVQGICSLYRRMHTPSAADSCTSSRHTSAGAVENSTCRPTHRTLAVGAIPHACRSNPRIWAAAGEAVVYRPSLHTRACSVGQDRNHYGSMSVSKYPPGNGSLLGSAHISYWSWEE
jgi:hypothetical protein